jgi:hypothetical protein
MSEFNKISRWIEEIETNLRDMKQLKADTEARIAKKISRLVLDTLGEGNDLTEEKVATCRRLDRLAKLVEAESSSMQSLEIVEREVDAIYGDQSANGTYYFGRKSAGEEELQQMKDLTTYEPEEYNTSGSEWEARLRNKDHDVVQEMMLGGGNKKKSNWSDYAEVEETVEEAFEDDGEWVDAPDLMDLDI